MDDPKDQSMHPVRAFAVVALAPAGLIVVGAALGGPWVWVALGYMTVFAWAIDRLIPVRADGGTATPTGMEARAAGRLSATLAIVHFLLLGFVVHALAAPGGTGPADRVALFLAAGLFFGQVSNANAHELIHRTDRRLFGLGKWVYISLLFGHHTSAHTKVHHRFAATPDDPSTARAGESFYAFAPRAWRGSFRRGYEMERADIVRRGRGGATPYVSYVFGAAGFLLLAGLLSGWGGLAAYVGLAAYAQAQLLMSDYVQHYGLTRTRAPDGRYEPIGPAHSWNAGQWFTAHLMLNAPRHSDHHAHPSRPFPALALPVGVEAPRLPASLPAMSVLALFPAAFDRVMRRALDARHLEVEA